jgi:hypothetical protein
MQIHQTPQQSSIVLRAGGAHTTSQWAREGASELGMGRVNTRHSLLLVIDVRRRPSLDEDDFEQMNNVSTNEQILNEYSTHGETI